MYCGPRATLFYFTQVGSTELDNSVLRNVLLYGVAVKYSGVVTSCCGGGRVGMRLWQGGERTDDTDSPFVRRSEASECHIESDNILSKTGIFFRLFMQMHRRLLCTFYRFNYF